MSAANTVLVIFLIFALGTAAIGWVGFWGATEQLDDLKARLDRIERGGRR